MRLRVSADTHNVYGKWMTSDRGMIDRVCDRMLARKEVANTADEEVAVDEWIIARRPFAEVTSESILDFPELTVRDLRIHLTGTYQMDQPVSYIAEMLNDIEAIDMKYVRLRQNILRIQVHSRHGDSKEVYIEYAQAPTSVADIRRHHCECRVTACIVGCCSHVATVVYYLSHARYFRESSNQLRS